MAFFHLLLAVLHVAIAVNAAASKPHSATATLKKLNRLDFRTVVRKDQARVRALLRKDSSVEPIVDFAGVSYLAAIGVGSPPTTYNLIVDTGSSNTWVGATTKYVPTSTSSDTGFNVTVSYGTGNFSGEEYLDQVTITDTLVIPQQSIGVASTSQDFNGTDGILGIGPVDLTDQSLDTDALIPTVTDSLFVNRAIPSDVVSIYFTPPTSPEDGEIMWGGYNEAKTTSPVAYLPLTQVSPSSSFWGIDQSVVYGNTTILNTTAGIVDTGTSLFLLATDAYQKYVDATGAVLDNVTGLLTINPDQVANLQTLTLYTLAGYFLLVPETQYFPPSFNTQLGGVADKVYLIIGDIGSPSGQGFDFVNGQAFLSRYYAIFDTAFHQVGFAQTNYSCWQSPCEVLN